MSLPEGTLKLTDSATNGGGASSVLLPESLSVVCLAPSAPANSAGFSRIPSTDSPFRSSRLPRAICDWSWPQHSGLYYTYTIDDCGIFCKHYLFNKSTRYFGQILYKINPFVFTYFPSVCHGSEHPAAAPAPFWHSWPPIRHSPVQRTPGSKAPTARRPMPPARWYSSCPAG